LSKSDVSDGFEFLRFIQETFSLEKQHAILDILKGVWLVAQNDTFNDGEYEISDILNCVWLVAKNTDKLSVDEFTSVISELEKLPKPQYLLDFDDVTERALTG
jgi:hypothetical protein